MSAHRGVTRFALVALVGAWACGNPVPDLRGRAALGSPIVGATVTVEAAGQARYEVVTDFDGTFLVQQPASLVGQHVRVVVTGGTFEGQPFADTLSAELDAFDPARDLVYVNAVTTLASLHARRHPGMIAADAAAAVKDFLAIPQAYEAGVGVDNKFQRHFSHRALLAQAPLGGPVALERYLDGLLDELDAGVGTHTFAAVGGVVAETIEELAGELGKMLGSNGFGFIFESVLSATDTGSTAQILDLLEGISEKLTQIQVTIDRLKRKVDANNVQLAEASIAPAKDTITLALRDLQHYTHQLQGVPACLTDPVTKMRVPGCTLTFCQTDKVSGKKSCVDYDAALKERAKRVIARILVDDANGMSVLTALKKLQAAVVAASEDNGLLRVWATYLRDKKRFIGAADDDLKAIYDENAALQLMAVTLVVDAERAEYSHDYANQAYGRYQASVATQEAVLDALLPAPGTIEDIKTGLVWLQTPIYVGKRGQTYPSGLPYNLRLAASDACDRIRFQTFGGWGNWRLPSSQDLATVVEERPDGADYFDWLVGEGFMKGSPSYPSSGGFVQGNNTYYSLTTRCPSCDPSLDLSYTGLWHDGISYACVFGDTGYCASVYGHSPDNGFAWCVTNKHKAVHARCSYQTTKSCAAPYVCEPSNECIDPNNPDS